MLHSKRLVWENRGQVFEARTVLKTLNFPTVDLGNLKQWWILAIYACRSHHTQDAITRAQTKISNNLLVDKGVVIAFHIIACTNPAVAFVTNLKNTLNSLKALSSRRCSVYKLNQIRLVNACVLNAQLSCFSTKLRKLHLLQSLFGKRWLACLALLAILVALVVLSTIARRTLLVVGVCVFLCLLALLSRFFWLSITMSTTCCTRTRTPWTLCWSCIGICYCTRSLLLSCTILLLNTTLLFSKVLLSRIVILASCTLCLCFSKGRSRSYLCRRLSCVLNNLGKAISVYNVRRNLATCLDLSQDLCLCNFKGTLMKSTLFHLFFARTATTALWWLCNACCVHSLCHNSLYRTTRLGLFFSWTTATTLCSG